MKKMIRPVAFALVTLFSAQLLTSCFGKFALVNMLYKFNAGIGGKDMGGKVIRSIALWVLIIIPVYEILAFVDFIIINLIEFWAGSNPIAMKEGESETQLITYAGREFQLTATKGKMSITELSGKNKGKQTVLYFNSDNSVSILNNDKMVKIADYKSTPVDFASVETGFVIANN